VVAHLLGLGSGAAGRRWLKRAHGGEYDCRRASAVAWGRDVLRDWGLRLRWGTVRRVGRG
jgi:hypothetical protein